MRALYPRLAGHLRWLVTCLALASAVGAQEDSCADCHFANPAAPEQGHLQAWQGSAHGRQDVGCSRCHGGDPSTFTEMLAHRDIRSSSNPASPTHRSRLLDTCGSCHPAQAVEFRKSRHAALLESDERAPTCATCHGSVAAHLLGPRALERTCSSCHGDRKIGGHPEFPELASSLIGRVTTVRELLKPIHNVIRRAREPRRSELEQAYEQALVPLREAVIGAHAFNFEGFDERLEEALERSEALMVRVAGPPAEVDR